MKLVRRPLALAAVLSATALAAGATAPVFGASAGSGVTVTNTETVQVYTSADGKIDTKQERIYEQLVLTGHGQANVANPVSTDGLRNLDGFGGVSVQDGKQVVDTTVDGSKQYRTVSNYTGQLPLTVSVAYELDGKPVSASQVVGKSGHLKVSYTITNTSGVDTPVTYKDGHGNTVTKTLSVPVPMVATLTTTTPDTFRNVTSRDANMGGDGHGGMMMNYTLTLLPPIGPASATVSYEADIADGVIPRAELQGLPVDPLTNQTFASAADQYKGGADQGVQLTDGATQLDGGLLQLRGGASQLLAGLLKLHDGAGQLSAGLSDSAIPGANQLADGTTQLDDGGKQLADGAGRLNDGLQQLRAKAPQLADGVNKIAAGQKQLAAGLATLYNGVAGLPKQVQTQVNSDATYHLLMTVLLPRLLALTDAQHATALKDLQARLALGDADNATLNDAASALGLGQLIASQLQTNLPAMVDQITTGIRDQLLAGIGTPTKGCNPTKTLRCAAAALADGGQQLADAVPQLTSGVNQLADGSQKLSAGAGQLSTGLGQADDGAHQLASGLGAAADGAGKIDDGLGKAADGAPKLVAGLKQASDKGAKKIASAGDDTAKTFAQKYAELAIGAKRAHTAMAIGAPDGATGLVAYDFIIQGADGRGGRDVNRGLMAGGLLMVGAGGFLVRRRFL